MPAPAPQTLGYGTEREDFDPGASVFNSLMPLVIVVAFAFFMQYIPSRIWGGYIERILLDIGIAIIAAVSLNMVNGYTGQFSIGHAAFMAIGGYVAGFITYYSALKIWGTAVVPVHPVTGQVYTFGAHSLIFAGACFVGGLAAAGAGWLVGLPSLRLKGDYLAIVTLGFGEIMRVLLQQTNGQFFSAEDVKAASLKQLALPPAVGGAQGFSDIPKVTNMFWMYLFVGFTALFAYRLKQSSYGRAMLSIREDEIAAEAMGVNVTKLKVRAFIFAAFFAGIAGSLYSHQPGSLLRPIDAGFQRSFDIVIMVVLGGLGSISGAILAAIIVTAIQAWLLGLAEYKLGGQSLLAFRMPVFALLLILTMIFRPKGLFGVREIWDFLPKRRKV